MAHSDPFSPGRAAVPAAITQGRVITIVRGEFSTDAVLRVGEALARAGIRAMEVTLNSASALASIEGLTERFSPDELAVGAGTVLDITGAQRALDAGAQFFVSPDTNPELIGWAARRQVPSFPGAMTPTEIVLAWSSGASAVKLFPAAVGGPRFIRDLAGPLPHIPLMAVGGVTAENAASYVQAGVEAVGIGGWLIGDAEPAGVHQRASELIANLASTP
jgi:2-dehydro-3-deoxyphosphogluconate aldolase/(4S)-4-hydroxy-2-oxoglutarate aldolase